MNEFALQESDIVSFHNYGDLDSVARQIAALRTHGRPVVCTEWMRRTGGSVFSTHLPLFKSEGVGCYFWGLVNGRTQTHFPWGSPAGAPEPETWFHDLLHSDGRPYCDDEIALLKNSAGFPLPSMA